MSWIKILIGTFCVVLVGFSYAGAAQKERLAVLDLEPKFGIEENLAEALSAIVRDEIHSYGEYVVMSREDLRQVASREQMLQAMGCEEAGDCLLDFGRTLGTRFMIVGSISKIGNTYSVNLRMLDTKGENAGLVNRVSDRCQCTEDGLITTIEDLSARIIGRKNRNELAKERAAAEEKKRREAEETRRKKEQEELTRRSTLTVQTEPADAVVQILNIKEKYYPGISLEPGQYKLRVGATGYETRDETITLPAGAKQNLNVALVLAPRAKEPKMQVATVDMSPSAQTRSSKNVQYASASSKKGDTFTDPTTGMEFVFVPGGCFRMGSNDGDSDEKPVHEVCVDDFYIGKYEVTQEEYNRITGSNPARFKNGFRYPVEQVSWNDTQDFIRTLNGKSGRRYRLSTEAEWEYAARSSGKNEKYSGENSVDEFAWYLDNSGGKTHQVGMKSPNGLGIYDMSGNVWEWCQDWYDSDYYSKSPKKNPEGPGSGSSRVSRGGSWSGRSVGVRSANRYGFGPSFRDSYLGFRLVLRP